MDDVVMSSFSLSSFTIVAISTRSSLLLVNTVITAIPRLSLIRLSMEKSGSKARKTDANMSSKDISNLIRSLLEIAIKYAIMRIDTEVIRIGATLITGSIT